MRIALFGVSCVGKTTVGRIAADKLDHAFIDFDEAVAIKMGTSISKLKDMVFNEHAYRQKVKHILPQILMENPNNLVLAMPPSGLFREYRQVFLKHSDVITVALKDKAGNILNRLVFTDDNDQIVDEEVVNEDNAHLYYRSIQEDIAYYYATLRKARYSFDINGMSAEEAATALIDFLLSKY
jgi:shikimate kinase